MLFTEYLSTVDPLVRLQASEVLATFLKAVSSVNSIKLKQVPQGSITEPSRTIVWHKNYAYIPSLPFTLHHYLLYTLSLLDLLGDSLPIGHRSLPTLKTAVLTTWLDSKRKLSECPSSRCCPFPDWYLMTNYCHICALQSHACTKDYEANFSQLSYAETGHSTNPRYSFYQIIQTLTISQIYRTSLIKNERDALLLIQLTFVRSRKLQLNDSDC